MKLNIPGVTDALILEQYYHGLIPREDLPSLMRKNGEFLLRITEPQKGMAQSVVLSIMWNKDLPPTKGIRHFVIHQDPAKLFYVTRNVPYVTIQDLVNDYVKTQNAIDETHKVTIKKPVMRQNWEIDPMCVRLGEKIGSGAYGEVCKGTLRGEPVAVKQNHMTDLTKEQVKEIMTEARYMRRLSHPNIVKLVGISALDEPLLIIMELASNGSLTSFLTKRGQFINMETKAFMCQQLSWALCYIKNKNILHRDLALRNCLYQGEVVKLSDFGKTQQGPTYRMDPNEILPIRWLSPEVMNNKVFDFASEVWAFGVVCWEIYANGQEPYPGTMVRDVNLQVATFTGLLKMAQATPPSIRTLVEKNIFVPAAQRSSIEVAADQLELYTKKKKPDIKSSCDSRKSSMRQKPIESKKSVKKHKIKK